ncbi:MAG: hypothetical protein ACK40X_09525 [Armatimonadota bacterium]
MTFKGVVKNGVIVLLEDVKLPDRLKVQVETPPEFVTDEMQEEVDWERRVNALHEITGIGHSEGGSVGCQKHKYLADICGDKRKNVSKSDDEESIVRRYKRSLCTSK